MGLAHDGRKQGRCEQGATAGGACDAESAPGRFGPTSNDCLPAGASVGELAVDLLPMTTGRVSLQAEAACKLTRSGLADRCFCPGQPQPNACDQPPATHASKQS